MDDNLRLANQALRVKQQEAPAASQGPSTWELLKQRLNDNVVNPVSNYLNEELHGDYNEYGYLKKPYKRP